MKKLILLFLVVSLFTHCKKPTDVVNDAATTVSGNYKLTFSQYGVNGALNQSTGSLVLVRIDPVTVKSVMNLTTAGKTDTYNSDWQLEPVTSDSIQIKATFGPATYSKGEIHMSLADNALALGFTK